MMIGGKSRCMMSRCEGEAAKHEASNFEGGRLSRFLLLRIVHNAQRRAAKAYTILGETGSPPPDLLTSGTSTRWATNADSEANFLAALEAQSQRADAAADVRGTGRED